MTSVAEVKSAQKRAVSMGKHSGWLPEYNTHKLAACIDNYSVCIDIELEQPDPDFFEILCWIHCMAKAVNVYCDEYKVVGDQAAQYWLHRFLEKCNVVCDFTVLKEGKK